MKWPSRQELLTIALAIAVWLAVTAQWVGLRTEHLWLTALIGVLLVVRTESRKLVVALLPFIIFGVSYDWMNILPNYKVNPVDIRGIYETEKALFGIGGMTPNEFFAVHQSAVMDFLAGVFYLCWVPVPILFGVWLYYDRQYSVYLHFALVFLLVNLLGFAGYYIHPAAPPWYVAMHGFEFIPGTHGETAGLGRWDTMMGVTVFDTLYARNANVFAAVPSLHSAYMLVAFIYALKARTPLWLKIAFAVICCGIWATAVYTSHHYLIDVLLGIGVTILGWLLFEKGLMRIPAFRRFLDKYSNYIAR